MPSLSAHFDIALKSEDRDSVLLIDETFGAYLLGSVTPDIRIINKQDRIITHFSDPVSYTHLTLPTSDLV